MLSKVMQLLKFLKIYMTLDDTQWWQLLKFENLL